MIATTSAGDVARSGLVAIAFALVLAAWVHFLIERFAFGRRRRARIWNWVLTGLVGIGGLVALVVAAFMWATGATFR